MSIKLMSAIFDAEFRDLEYVKDGEVRKAKASTCKLLLLAIADHANDYGESAYPGYNKLEIKTALSRQGIADTICALVNNGLLFVSDTPSRLRTNDYKINISAFPKMKDESSHLTGESQATGLALVKPLDLKHQVTIKETTKCASALSAKDLEQANAKVDYILETNQAEKAWAGREHIRPDLLIYADWYHGATGQVMTKRVQSAWWKALAEWKAEGLAVSDLQEAFDARSKWRKVASPNELTSDAAAIHALPKTNGKKTDEARPIYGRISA